MASVDERWSQDGFQDLGKVSSSMSLSQVTSLEDRIKSRISLWSELKFKTLLNIQELKNQLYLYMKTKLHFCNQGTWTESP